MTQLIIILPVMMLVILNHGKAAGQSLGHWVPPLTATLIRDKADHLSLPEKVKGNSQYHKEINQTKEDPTQILETDAAMEMNTIMLKTDQSTISPEEILGRNLHSKTKDSTEQTETINSIHNDAISAVLHKEDFVIPYDSLGWFSKAVEVAMDGSLYIGLALGIMFIAASLLTGAVGVFGETCLICSFIGYANTVAP